MTAPQSLADLQRWFLGAITHPAGVAAGTEPDPNSIAQNILPSRQQTSAERLAVYSHAYFARLLEVLRELFPGLRHAVGDELFDQFAVQYLEAHPPTSYTLHTLADKFADHLQATRPADDSDWAGFIVDLSRLEHAIDQVFDGPGPEGMPSVGSALCDVPETSECLRLSLVPGFRLLAFAWPVSSYFTDWKAGRNPEWPSRQPQCVALLRRDFIVRRHELSRSQFDLLSQLAAGQSLEESLAAISGDVTPTEIQDWFTLWAAEGFFAANDLAATSALDPAAHRPAGTVRSE